MIDRPATLVLESHKEVLLSSDANLHQKTRDDFPQLDWLTGKIENDDLSDVRLTRNEDGQYYGQIRSSTQGSFELHAGDNLVYT